MRKTITNCSMILTILAAIFPGTVGGECAVHQSCDDFLEILQSVKAQPENYQQLINAFYPINYAKPFNVIIAYFTNYTDPLPEECSLGTYPWRTYPGINYTNHKVLWYMWTTTPINSISNYMSLLQAGEYLPVFSYYFTFNKTTPLFLVTPIACIKLPYVIEKQHEHQRYSLLGDLTSQVRKFHVLHPLICSNTCTSIFTG